MEPMTSSTHSAGNQATAMIDWLLDADPSIRWQAMRDLLDAPESQWRAERTKVEAEGWGAPATVL
jgi:hypothetical protein